MALATLSIDMVAKLAKLEGDLGKLARTTEQDSRRMTAALSGVKAGLSVLAAGLSAAGLVQFSRDTINGVDALNDLKDATGASIENLSGLEDVAARTGTSMDAVGAALTKFNGVLKDTKPGSDAAAIFDGLGLSLDALKAMDPGEALRVTSVALQGITDDGTRARVVQELFGKSVREVAPFLKDLAEQGALVATVTTEQADQAERFNKQLFAMQKNVQDGARALSAELLPALNDGIARFKLAYNAAGSFFGALKLYKGLDYGQDIEGNLALIDKEIARLRERETLLTHDSAKKGNASLIADQEKQRAYLLELRQMQELAALADSGYVAQGRNKQAPVIDFPGAKIKTPGSTSSSVTDAAKEELRFQKDLLEAKRQITIDEGKAIEDRNEKYQQAIADEMAAREKHYAALRQDLDATQAANATLAEHAQEIGLTTEQVNTLRLARMDATIAQQEHTLAVKDAHGADAEEIALLERRISLLREARDITAKGQIAQASADTKAEQDRASKDYATTLRGDLKGALSAAFRDTKDPIAAFGDALANTVFTRLSAAVAESMVTSLLGSASSGASAGILGGLLSFEGGGSTGNGARSGGLDGRGGFLSILHPKETVTDHTRSTGQSSAPIINIIEAPGKGGQVSQRSEGGANVIDIMVEQIKGAIAQDISSGNGSVPRAMASTYGLNRVAGAY